MVLIAYFLLFTYVLLFVYHFELRQYSTSFSCFLTSNAMKLYRQCILTCVSVSNKLHTGKRVSVYLYRRTLYRSF